MVGEGSLGSPDARPCFYKVMLPENLLHLRIPSDFKEHIILRKEEESDGVLVTAAGEWHVKLIQDQKGDIYLRHGWQDFVKHHSLGKLELLLFNYNGHLSFDVTIFNKNGSQRTYQQLTRSIPLN